MEKSWAGTGLFRVDASMKPHEHPASVVGDLLSAFEPAMVEIASIIETFSGSFLWALIGGKQPHTSIFQFHLIELLFT